MAISTFLAASDAELSKKCTLAGCVLQRRDLSPHTTRDDVECDHVSRVHELKQRARHFIGLPRALRLCFVHSHGLNVRRVLRVLRELLLPRWPRLRRAEFVLGATIVMACPAIPLRTVALDSEPRILNQVIFAVHIKLPYMPNATLNILLLA